MPFDLLSQYLENVESAIRKLEDVYVERYEEEIVAADRVNLRIRVRFASGHMLELNEAVIGQQGRVTHLCYRYHLQDPKNNLVFRYDNTPHFPELENFPHHKHLPDKVAAAEQPSILKVIEEARLLGQLN
jgi:hypothetical protein